MDSLYDIFISYSSKDRETVHNYAKYLEGLGYKVWFDAKGLYTGAKFSKEIVEAIENSSLFLFFSSVHSNASDWTHGEVLAAQKFGKKILPIKLDDTEYDKSIMLVLLPLQQINCSKETDAESLSRLKSAIIKFIGEPSGQKANETSQDDGTRKLCKASFILSACASVFLSFGTMAVSGEYGFNQSLTYFTVLISIIFCMMASAAMILYDKNWNKRSGTLNAFFLLALIFFISYTTLALGLCFVSSQIFLLNSPSIVCSILAIYALRKLMDFKRLGYRLLWVAAFLFAVGSYFWIGIWIAPVFVIITACGMMMALKFILLQDFQGKSAWERLD